MNGKSDRVVLFLVTISFILVGFVFIYFTFHKIAESDACTYKGKDYSIGQTVEGYESGSKCVCGKEAISCTKDINTDKIPPISKFLRSNLKVTPKYLSAGTKEPLASMPLQTRFTSVTKKSSSLSITIEQEQKCTPDMRVPVQIGMYYMDNSRVYITNIVNKDKKFVSECVVSINYVISNISDLKQDFNIAYISENGQEIKSDMCNYEGKLYANGDIYSAHDNCNICTCSSNISKCSNDRVCTTK